MPLNSEFGKRAIVGAMLGHPRAEFMASRFWRILFRFFGTVAIRLFGWPLDLEGRVVARAILAAFRDVRAATILDAGSSFGVNAFPLARAGHRVIGLDIDRRSLTLGSTIRRCSVQRDLHFITGTIEQPPFVDDVFDAVLMSHVLEHTKDDEGVIKNVRRLLKPGGILVMAFPYREGTAEEYDVPVLDFRGRMIRGYPGGHWRSHYNPDSIAGLLSDGWSIEGIEFIKIPRLPYSPLLHPLALPFAGVLAKAGRNRLDLLVRATKAPANRDQRSERIPANDGRPDDFGLNRGA